MMQDDTDRFCNMKSLVATPDGGLVVKLCVSNSPVLRLTVTSEQIALTKANNDEQRFDSQITTYFFSYVTLGISKLTHPGLYKEPGSRIPAPHPDPDQIQDLKACSETKTKPQPIEHFMQLADNKARQSVVEVGVGALS